MLADKTGLLDQENTRKLGRASYSILFLIAQRCLERGGSLIIEGNFTLGTETLEFVSYLKTQKFAVVEILCHAPGQVLFDRFMKRKRHPVHHALDDKAHAEYAETLRVGKIPSLAVDRLLEVDTTGPVELQPILDFIRAE